MRRFFLHRDAICSHDPTIVGPDVKHIRTVLRLKPGDEIVLFDGEGTEYRARIEASTERAVRLFILDKRASTAESPTNIAIGQALLKGRKADAVVRQLTELGATAFLPFVSERSVPRPDPARMKERCQRWETIAREALKQCGRSRPLMVGSVIPFERVLEISQSYHHKFVFHNDHPSSTLNPKQINERGPGNVIALIGPEGGFSDKEVELARGHGFSCRSLGPRVMKADTAAVAIAAVLQFIMGDLGRPVENPPESTAKNPGPKMP
jgi:16S rRNA (uracil1498-N3)-methyltransferase